MKIKLLFFFLCLSISHVLFSQDINKISLAELYERSLSYPGLRAGRADIKAEKLEEELRKKEIFPEIRWHAQNTFGTYDNRGGALFALPGTYTISGVNNSGRVLTSQVTTTVKWDVIQFGKHADRVELSKINREKTEIKHQADVLELKKSLTGIYLRWTYARYMDEWSKKEIKRDRSLLLLSRSRVRSGLVPAADSLLVESALKQAMAQSKKWRAEIQQTENLIYEFTGLSVGEREPVEQFLSFLPGRNEESNILHPLLKTKQREKAYLETKNKELNHQSLPDISALGGVLFRGTGYNTDTKKWRTAYELPASNYLLGLGITWDLGQFYFKSTKKKRNQQKQFAVKEETEALRLHLSEQEHSSSAQIQESVEEINLHEEALKAARNAYALFLKRYESGLIDMTSLMQMQQTLLAAEEEKIKSYYNHWRLWNKYAYTVADYSFLTSIFN